MTLATFQFLDPGPLVDRELQLVPPSYRWLDDMLFSCSHPLCHGDETAEQHKSLVHDFLKAAPDGREMPDVLRGRVASYHYWMRLRPEFDPPIPIAGMVGLRVGDSEDLRLHLGHVGYSVYPAARGRHLAERAVRLILPLARRHGQRELWITTNPENIASRRTCERLGAQYISTVRLPKTHPLYKRGERMKCRYRLDL
ncbi:MAG: GNAT family N-acetyltransferase [Phycisphaerae bacterium]